MTDKPNVTDADRKAADAAAALTDTPTRADRADKLAALPEPQAGYERRWKHCRTHDRYGFYDFVPYSLSNPIAVMPCGCDAKLCNAVSKAEVVATERIAALEGEVLILKADKAIYEARRDGPLYDRMLDMEKANAALEGEVERLREALRKAKKPHWFYLGDDCSSEQCRFGIDECINEDFEWDNEAKGDHVLQISGARPVPDMWIALHYFTAAEKDERQDDEAYTYTVHATEEEARAALKGTDHDPA